jgi:hypothetical protein
MDAPRLWFEGLCARGRIAIDQMHPHAGGRRCRLCAICVACRAGTAHSEGGAARRQLQAAARAAGNETVLMAVRAFERKRQPSQQGLRIGGLRG